MLTPHMILSEVVLILLQLGNGVHEMCDWLKAHFMGLGKPVEEGILSAMIGK